MNTFLPYSDFNKCAAVLDGKRLWKQVLEAESILKIIQGKSSGYKNHSIVRMWRNYSNALLYYRNCVLEEWMNRRLDNKPVLSYIKPNIIPHWLGDEKLHSSHRAALLFKNFDHYNQFGWGERPEINYFWAA